MKLVLQAYLADQQQLLFSVEGEKDSVYRLMSQLNNRILFHCKPLLLDIQDDDHHQFRILNCHDKTTITFLLSNIQPICERNGIENWQAFADQVKNAAGIATNSQAIVMNSFWARDIRFKIANLSNKRDQASFMAASKSTHLGFSAEESLRRLFPHIHQTLSNSEAMKNVGMSQEDRDKAYLLARKTAYAEEYKEMSTKNKFLMNLCKTGDVVRYSDQLTKEEYLALMESRDINRIYALDWAYKNEHYYLLNKLYQGALNALFDGNENTQNNRSGDYTVLSWAIACRQPLETLERILRNNLAFYQQHTQRQPRYNTPIYTAIDYRHYEAIDLLQKLGVDLSQPDSDGRTVLHKALHLKNNYLEVARYLAEKMPALKTDNLLSQLIREELHLQGLKFACEQLKLDVNKGSEQPLTVAIYLDGCFNEEFNRVKYLCSRPDILLYHSNTQDARVESVLYQLLRWHSDQTHSLQQPLSPHNRYNRIFLYVCAQPAIVFGYLRGSSLFASHEALLSGSFYDTFILPRSQTYLDTALRGTLSTWMKEWTGLADDVLHPLYQCLVGLNQRGWLSSFAFFSKMDFGIVLLANMMIVHVKDKSPQLLQLIDEAQKIITDTKHSVRDFQVFSKALQDVRTRLAPEEECKASASAGVALSLSMK